MGFLETILAAGGGSITGSLAGVATAYFQVQLQKAQIPLQMKELELERKLSEDDTERKQIEADAQVTVAAHEADKATYGILAVDFIRGLIRPLITAWCIYLMSDLTLTLWEIQDHDLDTEYWRELFRHLILTWTYLSTTVVMYWFGSRGGRPPKL